MKSSVSCINTPLSKLCYLKPRQSFKNCYSTSRECTKLWNFWKYPTKLLWV